MLRPYFLHHRELLGSLCRAAYETGRARMVEAAGEPQIKPGMVAVVQTFGDKLNWNPHIHAIVSRGGGLRDASFLPLPQLDPGAAELIFRHKVLDLLERSGLLGEERLALLLSWPHHTGFSVHNAVTVDPDDAAGIERLARYLLRSPLSLERTRYDESSGEVRYRRKAGHDGDEREDCVRLEENFDPLEFLARILVHVPAPRLHSIRYLGAYPAVVPARRRQASTPPPPPGTKAGDSSRDSDFSKARRLRSAELIRRIYEVDPLLGQRCGATMRILAFINHPRVIRKILDHLAERPNSDRAPPVPGSSAPIHRDSQSISRRSRAPLRPEGSALPARCSRRPEPEADGAQVLLMDLEVAPTDGAPSSSSSAGVGAETHGATRVPGWLARGRDRLASWLRYGTGPYKLLQGLSRVRDAADDLSIPTDDVLRSLFFAATLRIPSLNALEGALKTSGFQRLLGRTATEGEKACSSDTVARVLDGVYLDDIRQLLPELIQQAVCGRARKDGRWCRGRK